MRIAVVCPYSLSARGGVQDQVLALARELRRIGHEVDVIAPCDDEPPQGAMSMGRSHRFAVNGSTAPMAPTPSAARRVRRTLQRGRYDVLHLHEPLAPSITIPALIAHSAPVVGTFHAAGDRTPYRWLGPPLRRLARRVDARVAVSAEAAELARRHLGGTYTVLFNGVDVSRFGAAAGEDVVSRQHSPSLGIAVGRSPAERSILFVGRHEPRKGLHVLLESMASLPLDVVLWVAGDGPERARLQAVFGADPRIRWLGAISDDRKVDLLRSASVACVPSIHGESFGVVLLEAMAARTPLVASDLPGYRALTDRGDAALLVPPGNPGALSAGLRQVMDDDQLADSLRSRATAIALRYSMEELARRYIAIYEAVIDRRATGQPLTRPGCDAASVWPSRS